MFENLSLRPNRGRRLRHESVSSVLFRLEERHSPANLTLTSIELVDGNQNPQPTPVLGQMISVLARWTNTAMSGSESYVVRYFVDGVPADSATLTGGNGNFVWYRNGFYASPGSHTVQVTVDGGSAVSESNESDNTMSFTFTPAAPTDLPSKFLLPIGRTANQDWAINNYADVDPRSGQAADYRGGTFQYDGHDAIDAGPWGFDKADAGIPIYAAADGTVTQVDDGHFDRETTATGNPGNFVRIAHGNGWDTVYIHFAANTITVKVGDSVRAGQVIGLMGSSGNSTGPHLHYTALYKNLPVEVGYSPNDYWQNPLPYGGDVTQFAFDAGVTPFDPWSDMYESVPHISSYPTSQTGLLYSWVQTYSLNPGDLLAWRWIRPNGSVLDTTSFNPTGNDRFSWWYWSRPFSAFTGTPGTWQVVHLLNGNEIKRTSFTINATGEPSARVAFNSNNAVLIDGRTTPIDFGTVAVGGSGPTTVLKIENQGTAPLALSNYQLPPGWSIVGSPPTSVAAGASATLTLRLDSAVVGAKFGRFTFTTNDPDEPIYRLNLTGVVTGSQPAGTPVLTNTGPATAYNFHSLPRVLAATATVTDSDSVHFAGGSLRVDVENQGDADETLDQLGIQHVGTGTGQIGVTGTVTGSVTFGGTVIGTYSGGKNATPLVIDLNANATVSAVQALLRSITYAHTGASPIFNRRYIQAQLTDNSGKVSNQLMLFVTPSGVERSPTLSSLPNHTVARGSTVAQNGSFTDPFGQSWTATVDFGLGNGKQNLTLNGDKTFSLSQVYDVPAGTYSVSVMVQNNEGGFATTTFTVTVQEGPANLELSSSTIAENSAPNTVIGTLTSNDPQPGQSFTYTLVAGAGGEDNGVFNISGDLLRANSAFNFEAKNSYSIRVRSTNTNQLSVEQVFTITVSNVPEAPTDVALSNTTLAELSAANAVVGTLSATDPEGPPHTFTLVSGTGDTDNAKFTIVAGQLRANQSLLFADGNRSVRIRATDGNNLVFEKSFVITITNVVEPPTSVTLTQSPVAENLPIGTVVGTFSSAGPDTNQTYTYTLVSGPGSTDNVNFDLVGNQLLAHIVFNYEAKNSHTIRVRTTNSANLFLEQTFTVTITNVLEAPTNLLLTPSTLAENSATNAPVGVLAAIDQDGPSHVFTFVPGPGDHDNGKFTIVGTQLRASQAFLFNNGNRTVRIRANEPSGLSFEKALVITITNVNDSPTDLKLSKNTVTENVSPGTVIGSFSSTDPDRGDARFYSLVSGPGSIDNGAFRIDSQGRLTTAAQVDYEKKATYSIRAQVRDAGNRTFVKTFTIAVINVNEAPVNRIPTTVRSLYRGQTVVFSGSLSLGVLDVDASAKDLRVTIGVANGTFRVLAAKNLRTFAGNGTSNVVFVGSQTNINAALANAVFTPKPGFLGTAKLRMLTTDHGYSGLGGAKTDDDTLTISILNRIPTVPLNFTLPSSFDFNVRRGTVLAVPRQLGLVREIKDQDGDWVNVKLVTKPSRGILFLRGDGGFTYQYQGRFTGTETFTVRYFDGYDLSKNVVVVRLHIS